MKTPLKLLIEDLMYLKQLNDDDKAYTDAVNDIIYRIEAHYIKKEREHIQDAFENGCKLIHDIQQIEIRRYYEQRYDNNN